MKLTDLVTRAEQLIQSGVRVRATNTDTRNSIWVNHEQFAGFRTASLSFLSNLFGTKHPYYTEFNSKVEVAHASKTEYGIGILRAVKGELEGGWLTSAKGLVAAEIFSDFLEMAEHLLKEGYKDAAAVMIGSVLEEHLRTLSRANSIAVEYEKDGNLIPKKADRINSDLAGAEVYSKLDQKNITAWLDLRNRAAHGKYEEYTLEQVSLMRASIVDFMARTGAH